MTTQPHDHGCVDPRVCCHRPSPPPPQIGACYRCGAPRDSIAGGPQDVTVPPRVLAWSPQRGCITEPDDFARAVRAGELLLDVDDDQIIRGIEGDAPLVAVVRADSAAHQLARNVAELHARIDDLHVRLVDAAEGALEDLIRKR